MAKKPPTNPPLDEVLIECAFHLGRGVGDATVTADAYALWTTHYRETFAEGLKHPKANWKRDKRTVLPLATKLGRVAAALAAPNPIDEDTAQAASDIVEQDPSCPTDPGQGKYCA
jgi:cell division septation protein DedD